jgi:uncharacterized membrane protein
MKIRIIYFLFLLNLSFLISCKDKNIGKDKTNNYREIIESKTTLYELYDFLKSSDIKYEESIEEYHHTIKFDSFSVVYDKYGLKINEQKR